jgi:hypothetical protein
MFSHFVPVYGKFVSFKPSFHQVCSSDFTNERSINAIDSKENLRLFSFEDFRRIGSAQFQGLAGFCHLSKSNTDQSISSFSQNILLSPQVLSENVLQSYTNATIDHFKLTLLNTFKSQLRLINRMIIGSDIIPRSK